MYLSIKHLITFCSIHFFLSAVQIDTFYGQIEIEEPVLIELIESPAFQRLKLIHQYGIAYYTTHKEEYTRYDHSLGVFAILRAKNFSLTEQIAGLLHDVSHTVFSHVGDWIYGKAHQEHNYQDSIHEVFLEKSGLAKILRKHGFRPDQVLPLEELFPGLEQRSPNLCADRIDYNIQGAYYQNFISYAEAMEIFNELQFIKGNWVSTRPELMQKLVRFSLFMTQDCWGSPTNHMSSTWFAEAILRAVDIGCLSYDDIHFGTDEEVWNRLIHSKDSFIQNKMQMVMKTDSYYSLVSPSKADFIVKCKFRGIDPWISREGNLVRLSAINPILAEEYTYVKNKMNAGWAIKLHIDVNKAQKTLQESFKKHYRSTCWNMLSIIKNKAPFCSIENSSPLNNGINASKPL